MLTFTRLLPFDGTFRCFPRSLELTFAFLLMFLASQDPMLNYERDGASVMECPAAKHSLGPRSNPALAKVVEMRRNRESVGISGEMQSIESLVIL